MTKQEKKICTGSESLQESNCLGILNIYKCIPIIVERGTDHIIRSQTLVLSLQLKHSWPGLGKLKQWITGDNIFTGY